MFSERFHVNLSVFHRTKILHKLRNFLQKGVLKMNKREFLYHGNKNLFYADKRGSFRYVCYL